MSFMSFFILCLNCFVVFGSAEMYLYFSGNLFKLSSFKNLREHIYSNKYIQINLFNKYVINMDKNVYFEI